MKQVESKGWFQLFRYDIVLSFMIFFLTNPAIDCLRINNSLEDQQKSNAITKCICPFGWFTEDCRIEESVIVKPVVFIDPSWDDYSLKSSFKSMEDQICEEMGNIFGAKRVWCRLIYLRKGNKTNPTSDGSNVNKQEEPMDNGYIEPYDTPCSNHLCKSYEKCSWKGMGYRCHCKLFKYGNPCDITKVCDNDSCKSNQTCPALEDCYKCDCNLFKLEQICEYASFDLLLIGVVTIFTMATLFCIFLGRRRRRRRTFGFSSLSYSG